MTTDAGELMALAEELREYTALKYTGNCKCGKCKLVPDDLIRRLYAALRIAASQPDREAVLATHGEQKDKITREMLTTPMTDFAAQRLNQPMSQEERDRIEAIVKKIAQPPVAETDADAPGDDGLQSGVTSDPT